MDAVKLINENLDVRKVLEYYNFQAVVETEEQFRACCRVHDGDCPTAFVWNKNNNLWFCYTGECGGGDVFTLVEKIEHIPFVQAVEKLAEILELNIDGLEIKQQENRIKKEQLKWLEKQMKKTKRHSCLPYKISQTKYTRENKNFKRFSQATLDFYDAKFCKYYPEEDFLLKYKLVIPIKQGNEIIGAALRDTTGTHFPKWFYVPKGLPIGNILYNFKENEYYDEIILVEGIFDVWKFHEIGINNVVAVFGSALKQEQYKTLLKTGATITLCFDNDTAGNKCTKKTAEMFRNKTELKHIQLPSGKDPADCTNDELLSAYLNRTNYA